MVATALKTKFLDSGVVQVNGGQRKTSWKEIHWTPSKDIEIVGAHMWIGLEKPSIFEADAKLFIPDTVSDENAMMRHSIHRHGNDDTYDDHVNLVFPSDARPVIHGTQGEKAYWGYDCLNIGTSTRGIQFAWIVWYVEQ